MQLLQLLLRFAVLSAVSFEEGFLQQFVPRDRDRAGSGGAGAGASVNAGAGVGPSGGGWQPTPLPSAHASFASPRGATDGADGVVRLPHASCHAANIAEKLFDCFNCIARQD